MSEPGRETVPTTPPASPTSLTPADPATSTGAIRPASLVTSLILYHVCWLACVKEPTWGIAGMGLVAVTISMVTHLWLFTNRDRLLKFAAKGVIWGVLADAVLIHLGVLKFSAPVAGGWLPPLWMAGLWCNFALVWVVACGWLAERPMAAALFGVIGGPLAYYGGGALGAVEFGRSLPVSLGFVGIEWGLTMLVWTLWLDRREGRRATVR